MQVELSPFEMRIIMQWHDCAKQMDAVFTGGIDLNRKIEALFEEAVENGEDDFYTMEDGYAG